MNLSSQKFANGKVGSQIKDIARRAAHGRFRGDDDPSPMFTYKGVSVNLLKPSPRTRYTGANKLRTEWHRIIKPFAESSVHRSLEQYFKEVEETVSAHAPSEADSFARSSVDTKLRSPLFKKLLAQGALNPPPYDIFDYQGALVRYHHEWNIPSAVLNDVDGFERDFWAQKRVLFFCAVQDAGFTVTEVCASRLSPSTYYDIAELNGAQIRLSDHQTKSLTGKVADFAVWEPMSVLRKKLKALASSTLTC